MKQATITKIEKNKITAIINADSMCSHCAHNKNCITKDCSKKEIIINTNKANNYKVKDIIYVDIDTKNSFTALFFAYILPLLILLSVFYGTLFFKQNETYCGIISIISLIPYYFLLFLNKDKLKIEIKINDN